VPDSPHSQGEVKCEELRRQRISHLSMHHTAEVADEEKHTPQVVPEIDVFNGPQGSKRTGGEHVE